MGGQLIVGKTNLGAADELMLLDSHTFRDVKCGERYNVKLIIVKEECPMTPQEIKEIMAFAIDYCQRNGTNVTTQDVYDEYSKDLEEGGNKED